jgi:hypothetical protein
MASLFLSPETHENPEGKILREDDPFLVEDQNFFSEAFSQIDRPSPFPWVKKERLVDQKLLMSAPDDS